MQYLKYRGFSVLLLVAVWFFLTCAILLIDYFGVNVLGKNGLVFQTHCYSYGFTFAIASIAFTGAIRRVTTSSFKSAILLGVIAGGIWWLVIFSILMIGFHSSIGGQY